MEKNAEYAEEMQRRWRRYELKAHMIEWVCGLAPWSVTATFTFKWEASVGSCVRVFEKFMRKEVNHASYFYAVERNPGRGGHHIHSVWADCRDVYRSEVWAEWFERYGRARIEPVKSVGHCTLYVTKSLAAAYAAKGTMDGWWNVNLRRDRKDKLNEVAFTLH